MAFAHNLRKMAKSSLHQGKTRLFDRCQTLYRHILQLQIPGIGTRKQNIIPLPVLPVTAIITA
jgi:hypothetical protein